ncbi:MAG: hypothetical protein ABI304_05255 [Rudaea sp.]
MTLLKSHHDPYSITIALSNIDIISMRTPLSNAAEIRQPRLKREKRINAELLQNLPANDPLHRAQKALS